MQTPPPPIPSRPLRFLVSGDQSLSPQPARHSSTQRNFSPCQAACRRRRRRRRAKPAAETRAWPGMERGGGKQEKVPSERHIPTATFYREPSPRAAEPGWDVTLSPNGDDDDDDDGEGMGQCCRAGDGKGPDPAPRGIRAFPCATGGPCRAGGPRGGERGGRVATPGLPRCCLPGARPLIPPLLILPLIC